MPEYNFSEIGSDSKSGASQHGREVLYSARILPISDRVRIGDLLFQNQIGAQEVYGQFNTQSRFVSRATACNTPKISVDYVLFRQAVVHPSRGFYDSSTFPHQDFFDSSAGEPKDA